jgi:hypothetical protein
MIHPKQRIVKRALYTFGMILGCALSVPVTAAKTIAVADMSVDQMIKHIQVLDRPNNPVAFLSTERIRSTLPRKNPGPDAYTDLMANSAWLTAEYDRQKKQVKVTITWGEGGMAEPVRLDRTRFKLPDMAEQSGPRPTIGYASHCAAGYSTSDEFGIVYTYRGGCADGRSYRVPVTLEVLRFLAARFDTTPKVPMNFTLEGDGAAGKTVQRNFVFYPAEAKALVSEIDRIMASPAPAK